MGNLAARRRLPNLLPRERSLCRTTRSPERKDTVLRTCWCWAGARRRLPGTWGGCGARSPRELARDRTTRWRHEAYPADCYARTWRREARRQHRVSPQLWAQVCRRLRERWSFEQIAGRFRRARGRISTQTIYRRIHEDERVGGTLHQYLRRYGWPRQRRRSPRWRRPLGRPLEWRPAIVATRQQVGHWEIDTVQGAGSRAPCLLSAVERKTG